MAEKLVSSASAAAKKKPPSSPPVFMSNSTVSLTIGPKSKTNENSPVSKDLSQNTMEYFHRSFDSHSNAGSQSSSGENTSISQHHAPQEWNALDLSCNGLKNVSPTLYSYFGFLTTLHLNGNCLTYISPEIAKLTNLVHLNLSGNNLKSLPSEIGRLVSLKELLLFDNYINLLPVDLGYLYQLETFIIDGNPLIEPLYSLNQAQGGLAVIVFLRDNNSLLASPPDRIWQPLNGSSDGVSQTDIVSLLSFNILSDRYAYPQRYGYVPSWALEWEYRREQIVGELFGYNPDILCIQEIDGNAYSDFFKQQMREKFGYESVFVQKSRCKTMSEKDRKGVDGCATFFRSNRFRLDESILLEFSQLASKKPEITKNEEAFQRLILKDNISLVVRLTDLSDTQRQFIVANVHIHWNPEFKDVKLVQTILLSEELEKLYTRNPKSQLLIAGDFNSTPDSGVYKFLDEGAIAGNHEDFMGVNYGKYTTIGASHNLSLRSIYSLTQESSQIYTNYTPWFKGHIDYIWYKSSPSVFSSLSSALLSAKNSMLLPVGLLGGVSDDYLDKIVGLPSQHYPSDHIPIMAEFKIVSESAGAHDNGGQGVTHRGFNAGAVPFRVHSQNQQAFGANSGTIYDHSRMSATSSSNPFHLHTNRSNFAKS